MQVENFEKGLAFYGSQLFEEPDRKHCEFASEGKTYFKIYPNNNKKAYDFGKNEWYFMTLVGDSSIQLTLSLGQTTLNPMTSRAH